MKKNKLSIYEAGYNLYDLIDEIDPERGIKNQVSYIKKLLKANSVILFNRDDSKYKEDIIFPSNCVYHEELKELINSYNKRKIKDVDINLDGKFLRNLLILNIPVNDKQFVLGAANGIKLEDNKELINVIKKTLKKNISMYDKMNILKAAINTDKLTFINNRACFEEDKIKHINDKKKIITFVMADLFRLKHINDTYGHKVGDKYIVGTAKILAEVFNNEKSKVYRLSGDEFAVIIEGYDIISLEEKLSIAQDRVANLDLGVEKKQTMINVGVAVGAARDIDKISTEADNNMNVNKTNMYKLLKVNRT